MKCCTFKADEGKADKVLKTASPNARKSSALNRAFSEVLIRQLSEFLSQSLPMAASSAYVSVREVDCLPSFASLIPIRLELKDKLAPGLLFHHNFSVKVNRYR
ncbi:hypothetical protein H4Q26_000667 [Puccinia striiformis f. sp. tritici PST-130]|nr:hypothetical protein H4Q26_000667 [Puccinia striiformis f. sp. tritici PST-130]